ncbi:MAG: asparaginase [Peptoniphilaceae bacterium]|uniref:asparaginase n=1 Tax=Parvimonas sp. TaxID=1944660 RepID=UPI002A749FF2|nr:asparaginase [Parvimonas sp.]MDD7764986.1 asparaginase [Peptoniphilaceae bacterium]MDY3050330.1 asparaginase [Parvimonas sp.]
MKKILLISTGGTIASMPSSDGLVPQIDSKKLLEYLNFTKLNFKIDTINLFNVDSTDMQPEHWLRIKDEIKNNYNKYDGFVITHGTDTMAYTASALSYLIQNSKKPIVLTGAQKSIDMDITDAKNNLLNSLIYASKEKSSGITIVFNGKVIAGTRARKERTKSFDAFTSINFPFLAIIQDEKVYRYITDRNNEKEVKFFDNLNTNVFVLKLIPSLTPKILDEIFKNYDAIIIESYGVGGIPKIIETKLKELVQTYNNEKIIIMTTQVPQEGSDIGVYEVGKRISSISYLEAHDMTIESTVTKIMWILGNFDFKFTEIENEFYRKINYDMIFNEK